MSGRNGKGRRIVSCVTAALAAASLATGVAVVLGQRGSEAPSAGDSRGRWFCPAKSLGAPAPATPTRGSCSVVLPQ